MRTKQFYSERTVTLLGWIQADVASRKTTLYSCLQTEISPDVSGEDTKALRTPGLLSPDHISTRKRTSRYEAAAGRETQFAVLSAATLRSGGLGGSP